MSVEGGLWDVIQDKLRVTRQGGTEEESTLHHTIH